MGLENFSQTLVEQMGNPDCSILTGMMLGSYANMKNIFMLFGIYMLFHYLGKGIDYLFKKVKLRIIRRKELQEEFK